MKSDAFVAPVYGSSSPVYGFVAIMPGQDVLAGLVLSEKPYGPYRGLN
jgi:hypothetical protein